MGDSQSNLIGGHKLVKNVIWNLAGTGAPLLVALIAIPILIRGLGLEKFGVLTIAWMVVGYFSLFDLGLGRALTKLVADKLGANLTKEIPVLVWTALLIMFVLGIVGAIIIAFLAPWLVEILNIPTHLKKETLIAFYVLAGSIPIVISTTGVRGILEAHQRFGLVNAVRIPLGVFTFLGPVIVLPFSNSLVPIISFLVVTRLVSWFVYVAFCFKVEPNLRHSINVDKQMVKPLLSFGGWMTISNIVGPIMVYMDRFLIGAYISMTAVAYYATPYEVVTKLWIVPGALMGVMFPAFTVALTQDRMLAIKLFRRVVSYIFISLFPVALIIILFAKEGLNLWLGAEFSKNSSLVLQLLAFGVFINSLAFAANGMVQGIGRPDLSAKLHMIELPFYLIALWWSLSVYGIIGAAVVWVVRVVVDALVLFVMANRLLMVESLRNKRGKILITSASIIMVICALLDHFIAKILVLTLILAVYFLIVWNIILCADEKNTIRRFLKVIPFVK